MEDVIIISWNKIPTVKSISLLCYFKDKPRDLSDFRPISLGPFASKIISKVIANRLTQFLPLLIDEQQYGWYADFYERSASLLANYFYSIMKPPLGSK